MTNINLQQNAKMTTTEPDENLGPCLNMKKIMHACDFTNDFMKVIIQ
jgi:hypothetical protein